MFWLASSALIYFTGVFFIPGLSNDILKMGISYFEDAWYINWSLGTIVNILHANWFVGTINR